jgi:glycosyltransferase involved in cell wall biosynthesis
MKNVVGSTSAPTSRPLGRWGTPIETGAPHTAGSSVLLIGTYPPTECGIATHTANLHCALVDAGLRCGVVRLLDADDDAGALRDDVHALWRRDSQSGLDVALEAAASADAVIIQHEFGIFPGRDGDDVVRFVERCSRPMITVLHTVVKEPSRRQRAIIEALGRRSSCLVVHTEAARRRLLATHDVAEHHVVVIPHGASPNLAGPRLVESTEPLLLTWGLLGPGKGIEHGIEAVALMRDAGLRVRYLVAGETHPNVRANEGERYREGLQDLARQRGVADLVDFDDRYRDWASLHAQVRSATIVLVPYDSRDQVTSGVLVEALAAGKPVVSTTFPHAVELHATGAVLTVEHESPRQIATAVHELLRDEARYQRMSAAARLEASHYDWRSVGTQFRTLISRHADVLSGVSPLDRMRYA